MTRDDIIRTAQKAGLTDPDLGECVTDYGDATEGVLRFAELVIAAERKQNLDLVQIIVEAEREACAKVCEQAGIDGYGTLAAAAMIRARGEK